jgi:hypothetical protein
MDAKARLLWLDNQGNVASAVKMTEAPDIEAFSVTARDRDDDKLCVVEHPTQNSDRKV